MLLYAFVLLLTTTTVEARSIFETLNLGWLVNNPQEQQTAKYRIAKSECDGLPVLVNPSITDIQNMAAATFVINGNLVLNNGDDLTITEKTIKMVGGANAGIYMKAGSILRLDHTTIEGCDQMWFGIESYGDHVQLLIYNGSEVNDMYEGITFNRDGYYLIKDSHFRRNYKTMVGTSETSLTFDLTCYGNTIDGAGLKPHWDGLSLGSQAIQGFYFKNVVNALGKVNRVGVIGQLQNVITHCGVGIRAERSDFDIQNNRFVGLNTGGPGRAIDIVEAIEHNIRECKFDYCVGGINASYSYYKVENNQFNHVGYCFNAEHSRKYGALVPTVTGSLVDGANSGFRFSLNDNSNPQFINNTSIQNMGGTAVSIFDMNMNLPNSSKISGNTIMLQSGFGTPAAGGPGPESGIVIMSTQKASICDNVVVYDGIGLDHGVEAWTSTNSIITNNLYNQTGVTPNTGSGTRAIFFDNSKFDCNYYAGNETGLQLMGPCTNTDITTQHFLGPHKTGLFFNNASTKPQLHAGNAWEYAPGVGQFSALGVGISVPANLFTVDCSDGAQYCPPNVSPQGWFMPQQGNTKTCNFGTADCTLTPPEMFQTPPAPDEASAINKIISGQLVFPNYTNCSNWMASVQALNWIASHNLQGAAGYSNYWNAKYNTSAGKLARLGADALAWQQSQAALEGHITAAWTDIQQLSASSSLSETQYNTLMQRYQDLDNFRTLQKNNQLAFVAHFRAESAALPVNYIFEDNQQKVNLILCDVYGRAVLECYPNELTILQSIAAQCPQEGGAAVLQARGLLTLLGQAFIATECVIARENDSQPVVQTQAVQVMPNPSNGAFHVVLPADNQENWQLEVFDMQGKSCWKQPATAEAYISGLTNGVYILVCTNGTDGSRVSEKLIVQE